MASKKISALNPGSAITGSEQFATALAGTNYRHTAEQVKDYVAGFLRERLTADRTYFVRTTGNDSNNGLTAGTAFLTLDAAADAVLALDPNRYQIFVDIGAGTFAGAYFKGPFTQEGGDYDTYGGVIEIVGAGKGTTIINTALDSKFLGFDFYSLHHVWLHNLTIEVEANSTGVTAYAGSDLYIWDVEIDGKSGTLTTGIDSYISNVTFSDGMEFTGTLKRGISVSSNGSSIDPISDVTFTDTPTFTEAFAYADNGAAINAGSGVDVTGTATGVPYIATGGATIVVSGDPFPGSLPGIVSDGGVYVENGVSVSQVDTLKTDDIVFADNKGISDDSGNELVRFQKVASAVNSFDLSNAATGDGQSGPTLEAVGTDLHVAVNIKSKGNEGYVRLLTENVAFMSERGPAINFPVDGNGVITVNMADTRQGSGGRAISYLIPSFYDDENVHKYGHYFQFTVIDPDQDAISTAIHWNPGSEDNGGYGIIGAGLGVGVVASNTAPGDGNIVADGTIKTGSTTFASLPSAAAAGSGARAFITNCNTTTFLATAAGGGANKVPVVSDGTNWLVG
jgi:hypothetical protein